MVSEVGALGPAFASWNDFVGTAAADECPTDTGPSLYEVAGLDPAAWIILSIDLQSAAQGSSLVVYALDRRAHGVGSHAELIELGQQSGELPVTAFEMVGPDADRRGAAAFERLSVRLVARPFHDQRLVVQARHPLPDGRPARVSGTG